MLKLYSPWLYIRDRWIYIPGLGVLGLIAFTWWYIVSRVHPTSDQVFLHYTIIFGVDLIGPWRGILLPAISGLIIVGINFTVSWLIYGSNRFLARLLPVATLILAVFLLLAAALLVGINT
ncbi:MAG: hypothetical protein HY983_03855 [Candidatus Magasanikbacteria bacterium]|nr:hypothetical protein [Candidatus Magasanikbacteria bacterium]